MSRIQRTAALATLALALSAPVAVAAPPTHVPDPGGGSKGKAEETAGKPIPGRYIVTLDRNVKPKDVAAENDAKTRFVYSHALNGFSAELTDKQVEKLRRHPHVQAVEEDQVVTGGAVQYTSGGEPWGLDRTDQRFLPLDGRYFYNHTGAGVRAYIIDSGLQSNHPQFGGRAINVFDAFGSTGEDCHGHGTHVGGIVGGATYGVAKGVMLRGVRVLGCNNSGTVEAEIAGIDWVRANAVKPAVANISIWGGRHAGLNQAVTNLVNSGVFVATISGNGNADACNYSPASAAGTFTTGATDRTDTRASFSNYGACVDGYAPGVNIVSARLGGGTLVMNGTSQAAPQVAGVVALGKQTYGDSYTSTSWVNWVINNSTFNVVKGNIGVTPNRMLFNPL